MQLFSIPIVKTPRKTKIIRFTKKQNNVPAFVNLLICPIMLFRRQYLLEVFVRFYFLVEITTGKASINWLTDKSFHILLLNTYQIAHYSFLLTEYKTGTFWLTDRDAGTEPTGTVLAKTGHMVCLVVTPSMSLHS